MMFTAAEDGTPGSQLDTPEANAARNVVRGERGNWLMESPG